MAIGADDDEVLVLRREGQMMVNFNRSVTVPVFCILNYYIVF